MSPKGLNTPSQKEGNYIVSQRLGCVEEVWLHEAAVGGIMMLGVVIADKIVHPRPPLDLELPLAGPVLDPIEMHGDCHGSFLNGFVCKALGSGVVDLHRVLVVADSPFPQAWSKWGRFMTYVSLRGRIIPL